VYSAINGLRSDNKRLCSYVAECTADYRHLAGTVSSLSSSVENCRRNHRLLSERMSQNERVVTELSAHQRRLESGHQQLTRGLEQTNACVRLLGQGQAELRSELENTREEQRRHAEHLQQVNAQIATLGAGQERLQRDLLRQREEINQGLECLKDYQDHLTGQIERCGEAITRLDGVTESLKQQQDQTRAMLDEVAKSMAAAHEGLQRLESVMEERHRAAQEAMHRQMLNAVEAQHLARDGLGLIDRDQAARFGLQPELDAAEELFQQAEHQRHSPELLNAALAIFCQVSETASRLRKQLRNEVRVQIEREQRIHHLVRRASAVADAWKDNEFAKYYHEEALVRLQQQGRQLEEGVESLQSVRGYRELTEQTATLRERAEALAAEAERLQEKEFPETVRKAEQQARFIEAIEKSIRDTFSRSGQAVTIVTDLAKADDRYSPVRLYARSETRAVVAEIDLDGNCHFWWVGYAEKAHVHDIEEFEGLLQRGRNLQYRVTTPKAFIGEEGYTPPPPPPDWFAPVIGPIRAVDLMDTENAIRPGESHREGHY